MGEPDTHALVAELRGFAEGSGSARATLMRDAADALERLAESRDWHRLQEAGLRDDIENLEYELKEARGD